MTNQSWFVLNDNLSGCVLPNFSAADDADDTDFSLLSC